MGDKRHLLIGANTTHRNYSSSRLCRLSTLTPMTCHTVVVLINKLLCWFLKICLNLTVPIHSISSLHCGDRCPGVLVPGPDSRNDPLSIGSDTIPDRPIAFHKRLSRSAHEIEKIWNQTVYCQLNHDINHSLGFLELKLRGRDWMKNVRWYLFMTSQWVVWRRHLWVPIRERHGQFSARTHCFLTIQHGLDMSYLTGMCMWLTSLKIYKLLTQDRPCSSKCFPVVWGF